MQKVKFKNDAGCSMPDTRTRVKPERVSKIDYQESSFRYLICYDKRGR